MVKLNINVNKKKPTLPQNIPHWTKLYKEAKADLKKYKIFNPSPNKLYGQYKLKL